MRQSTRLSIATLAATLLATLGLPATGLAESKTYVINESGPSKATFHSDATLETINGITRKVSGEVTFDPDNPGDASGYIEFPADSMNTGIALRDEHLASDKWLHADKYPKVRFEIVSVQGLSSFPAGETQSFKLKGKLKIHGHTKTVVAKVKAKRNGEGELRAKAQMKIELDDFGIDIPLPVRLKVSNEITLGAEIHASER